MVTCGDTIILGIRYGQHMPSHGNIIQRQSVLRALARQDAILYTEIAHAEGGDNPYRPLFPLSWTDPNVGLRLLLSLLKRHPPILLTYRRFLLRNVSMCFWPDGASSGSTSCGHPSQLPARTGQQTYDRRLGSRKRSKMVPVAATCTNLSTMSIVQSWRDHVHGLDSPSAVTIRTSFV